MNYSDMKVLLDAIAASDINVIQTLREHMDQRVQEITDKLDEIKAETGQYIADRDALDVQKDALIAEKDATIADLTAQLAAGAITIAQFQEGLDAAVTKADEAANLLPPVRPPEGVAVP